MSFHNAVQMWYPLRVSNSARQVLDADNTIITASYDDKAGAQRPEAKCLRLHGEVGSRTWRIHSLHQWRGAEKLPSAGMGLREALDLGTTVDVQFTSVQKACIGERWYLKWEFRVPCAWHCPTAWYRSSVDQTNK